ncbi:MAG: lytic transglycosylase domain-containing protein [Syntrophobacterales bacterium]|jgi:soluble lytic murein transglycosylase|nr:lytic transglycosylase domain-containing protein [Syntrophobacterales bacterium]
MVMLLKLLILGMILFSPFSAYCAVYGYVDEEGVSHFTNITPIGKKYHTVISDKKGVMVSTGDFKGGKINNSLYDSLIARHSETHGVDPSLVKAVVKAESNFNPNAISQKGAQGLMQLMPNTAKLMKVGNPFDPDENIKGGARYLRYLEDTFGDLELTLAAYNAGPQKVIEHKMNIPPIEETRNFIKRVKYYYNKLKNPYEG